MLLAVLGSFVFGLAGNDDTLCFIDPLGLLEPRNPLIHIGLEISYGAETVDTQCTDEVADALAGLVGYGLQVSHEWRDPRAVVGTGQYSRKDIDGCGQPESFVAPMIAVATQREQCSAFLYR